MKVDLTEQEIRVLIIACNRLYADFRSGLDGRDLDALGNAADKLAEAQEAK